MRGKSFEQARFVHEVHVVGDGLLGGQARALVQVRHLVLRPISKTPELENLNYFRENLAIHNWCAKWVFETF